MFNATGFIRSRPRIPVIPKATKTQLPRKRDTKRNKTIMTNTV